MMAIARSGYRPIGGCDGGRCGVQQAIVRAACPEMMAVAYLMRTPSVLNLGAVSFP